MNAPARRGKDAREIKAFTRRGACPALSAPMQTGDGLLVRLNPVAGGLSPNALIELCKAALKHGNGVVEVTARGSMQIRGLTPKSASLLAAEVDVLGIAVRTGVPVQTGALAELDPDEIADPIPLAERMRTAIVAAGLEARVGPKVSVVVDGGGRSGLEGVAADVRLTAVRHNANVLWHVAVGGDARTARPLVAAGEDIACSVAMVILSAIADLGLVARARNFPPVLLDEAIKPFEIQLTGLAASILPDSLAPDSFAGEEIGSFALTEARCALGIALPFGHTSAKNLIAFVEKAVFLGVSDIRLAPKRTILALCPSHGSAEALKLEAQQLGFVTSSSDPRTQVSACPGAPACTSGHIAARDLAAAIANDFSDFLDGSFTLHVSGCAKGCAHPGAAALTLVGSENGAGIVADGTARNAPLAYTAPEAAKRALGNVVELVGSKRREGENSSATLVRLGPACIAEVLGKQ